MPKLQIRKARHGDLPEVLQLISEASHQPSLPVRDAIRVYRKMWHYRNYRWYLALHGTRLAGMFSLLVFPTLLHAGASEAIIHIVVSPQHRQLGIGYRMLLKAAQICAEAGCSTLMIGAVLGEEPHGVFHSLQLDEPGNLSEIETHRRIRSVGVSVPHAVRVSATGALTP